ncbi:MAG: hypothetical protein ACK40O_04290 [Allosphingosinicella sp.]
MDVYEHFSTLGDYMWKLPRFIDHELEHEKRKLDEYFPVTEDSDHSILQRRRLRFFSEFGKLLIDFPDFMGASSFVMVMSHFEYYLLKVCRDHEAATGVDLDKFRGRMRGPSRLLDFVEEVSPEIVPNSRLPQLKEAFYLRNCLVHANGVLSLSKDAARVRTIVKQRLFYPPHRRQTEDSSQDKDLPRLEITPVGERLLVPVPYAHWLAYAARDVLMSLCIEASRPESQKRGAAPEA